MSPLLLPPILQGTLPGFPEAPTPGPFDIFIYILLIPGLLMIIGIGVGMGRHWLAEDASTSAITLPPGNAEILPSVEALQARRELVQQAAQHNEGRADLPVRHVKSDPETQHP